MPLIIGIRNWFRRRMADATLYVPADGGQTLGSTSWLWLVVFILLIPFVAVLVLVGLAYEVFVRIDGRLRETAIAWALSSAAAVALLLGLYIVFVSR